jgi:hypothetical protein
MVTKRAVSREGNTSYSHAKKEFLTISDEKNKSAGSATKNSEDKKSIKNGSDRMMLT